MPDVNINTLQEPVYVMSKEFAISLVPALVMLGFAIFGAMHVGSH